MALGARWSSAARRGHYATLPLGAQEPVSAAEVEALFVAWQGSANKGRFMERISLAQATALCDAITQRAPAAPVPAIKRDGPLSHGTLHKRRLACTARIAEVLGADAERSLVSAVLAVLASDYGACPVPRLITAEMVEAACARLGGRAKR